MKTIDNAMQLEQAHFDLLAKAVTFAETGEVEGWEDQYFDDSTEEIDSTHDELSSFDGATWRERRGREDFEIDGHGCIHWKMVQARKGDCRVSITVIDLGEIRLIYQL